jgi:hypothetical protein
MNIPKLPKRLQNQNSNSPVLKGDFNRDGHVTASDILDKFSTSQEKNEVVEVLKELFMKDKIEMISDLSNDEISLLTRIDTIAFYKDIPMWNYAKDYFIKLKLSKNRKSRKELIDAIKSHNQQKNENGLNNFFRR